MCYFCHRSRMLIIRPSSRTGRAIPASFSLKRFNRWPSLSARRQWHLGILLCWLWQPMVLHVHILHGPVTHGSRDNTAVHPWARVYWWKCTPEVVTSLSCCIFLPDFVGAWAGIYIWRFAVEYLHWRHTGEYAWLSSIFLSYRMRRFSRFFLSKFADHWSILNINNTEYVVICAEKSDSHFFVKNVSREKLLI